MRFVPRIPRIPDESGHDEPKVALCVRMILNKRCSWHWRSNALTGIADPNTVEFVSVPNRGHREPSSEQAAQSAKVRFLRAAGDDGLSAGGLPVWLPGTQCLASVDRSRLRSPSRFRISRRLLRDKHRCCRCARSRLYWGAASTICRQQSVTEGCS